MNSFGKKFIVSIFGESHGDMVGVVIDGTPAGIPLKEEDFLADLDRRRSGAKGTTPRKEDDTPIIRSGVFNGFTTGAPICITFSNNNTRSQDYAALAATPRPGHADFVVSAKYKNFNDPRGGGHTSGRLTLGLVAAGVIAKKIIAPASINARIISIGGENPWDAILERAMQEGDSLGGLIECVGSNMPSGLGEPFFNSAESLISHIIFSVPATKGIEFGDGFKAASMRGSEHNDPIISADGKTSKNSNGGINGGITNGNDLIFRVAIKPTSSISKPQQSFNRESGIVEEFVVKGRHDSCIALRIPVIIEAATAIALADLSL
jgi:chorismate synthase